MRVSDKQLLILFEMLGNSCKLNGNFGGLKLEDRKKLYNNLINQQDNNPIERNKE